MCQSQRQSHHQKYVKDFIRKKKEKFFLFLISFWLYDWNENTRALKLEFFHQEMVKYHSVVMKILMNT